MSLLRATAQTCPRAALTAGRTPRRYASDHAGHDAHHHDEHAVDTTVYPKEGFSGRAWIYGAAFGLGAVAFYKFAPAADGSSSVTRWLNGLREDGQRYAELNAKHLDLAYKDLSERRTVEEATLPPVHRYRFPQSIEVVSPHLAPVGPTVDMSNVAVKKD